MTFIQAIILGIIQGITEFLPVSSSGHLVILPYFLNWSLPEKEIFIFDVLVQLGTLVALIFYFRTELTAIITDFIKQLFKGTPFASHHARLGWLLIAATLITGVAGIILQDVIEASFHSPLFAGIALLVTAVMMIAAERISWQLGDTHDITLTDSIVMGIFQCLALFPGISRSGSTISGGMLRHLRRDAAGKFSFLMSIPIMLAAGGFSTYRMVTDIPDLGRFLPIMAAGFLTAMIVGYIAIRWLLKFLVNHSLIYFAIYCFLIGSITILVFALK